MEKFAAPLHITETTEQLSSTVDGQPLIELQEEMQLDFEETSDGELDEGKVKACGNVLGVDRNSIVEESKRRSKEKSVISGTGQQEWQPHHIFL